MNNHKDKEWLEQAYKSNSISEIAKMCGVANTTIRQYMKKFGIKSRTISESLKKKYNDDNGFREKMQKIWDSDEYRDKLRNSRSFEQRSETSKKIWDNHRDKIISAAKKSMNGDLRSKLSDKAKELWRNEEYRSKQEQYSEQRSVAFSEVMKNLWKDQEYRERKSRQSKENWEDERYRNKVTQSVLDLWDDPEFKDKHKRIMETKGHIISKKSLENWKNPKYRTKLLKIIREFTSTPEYRQKQSEISRRNHQNPEYKEKASRISKQLWNDPEYRNKLVAIIREFTSAPEYRQKRSEIIKKLWEDQEYRNKVISRVIEATSTEEYRQKQSAIASKIWQSPELRKIASENTKKRWEDPEYREMMAEVRASQPRITNIQRQLYKYLDDLGIEYYEESNKTKIGYFVFDCLIPKQGGMRKNLLIECQGEYWHSLDGAKSRDRSKFTYIDRYFPEYEIMYLWEHEFYNKDGALSRLKAKLGIDIDTIDFKFGDIMIKKPSAAEVRSFLDAYHYIGSSRGTKYCFGAYLGDKLIAVCVFSSPIRQNITGKFGLESSDVLELSRFCIHPCYHKKNFGSWFISRCLKMIVCKLVMAYSDETVGHNGSLYLASNFEFSHIVRPDYWYVSDENYVMHKRTLYGRASKMGITENEYAAKFGYHRVYGGRKKCFIYKLCGDIYEPK